MSLKDIGKRFQEKFLGKKTVAQIVEEEVVKPIQGQNLTPEERIERQAEKIIRALKEYPEDSDAIMKRVNADSRIPQRAIDQSARKATDSPEVSANVAATIAKGASDAATLYVMENSNLSQNAAIEVAHTLEDEEAQKEGACTLLVKLYNSLKTFEQQDILSTKIQNSLVGEEMTDDVKRELYKVIAKNFALTYYQCNGAISLYNMEKIIPLDEMMRVKMPQKIEEEYISLLKDGEENKFDEEYVTDIFLEKIAQESSKEAKEQGKSVDLFSPSDLGNLTDEEIEKYLDFLSKYTPSLTDLTRGNIRDRLKEQEQDMYTVDQFISTLRDLPDGERGRYLRMLSTLSTREMDTVAQCIESGLIENLSKKKVKDRKQYLRAINSSIEKRQERENKENESTAKYKIASREETPKVKRAEWGDEPR